MDNQSIDGDDTYPTGLDADSTPESLARPASARWPTTNSSNTMELERHLSLSSVTRDVRSIDSSHERYEDSDKVALPYEISTQAKMFSVRVQDSRGQMASSAATPEYSPSQGSDAGGSNNTLEESNPASKEKSQSVNMGSNSFLDPSLMDPNASRMSHRREEARKQEGPANAGVDAKFRQDTEDSQMNSPSDQSRDLHERLDPAFPTSTSKDNRRGRSPSPRPKVSAETRARWAMLKELAGVSQPHDVEEEDRRKRLDGEIDIAKEDFQVQEEAKVHDSWQTNEHADYASIERYLQKLQRDPHIDSRGLQEGRPGIHSHKDLDSQHDQSGTNKAGFHDKEYLGSQIIGEEDRMSGVQEGVRSEAQDVKNKLHQDKEEAEQATKGGEAALRKDVQALGGGLESGLQGVVHAAESALPHTNSRKDLQRSGHKLMGEFDKAEKAIAHTGLGSEIQRGEHELIGEVHKIESEFPHVGLGQEIRKGEAALMGDIHEAKNELAGNVSGQEVRKVERHLTDEIHQVDHKVPRFEFGQDLRRGQHVLKQGLQNAADHLHKQALGNEAEAVRRSVDNRLDNVKRLALGGAGTAGGLAMRALHRTESGNSAGSPGQNFAQPGPKSNNQQTPIKIYQPVTHPIESPGLHLATVDQKVNRTPANDRIRPSVVEPSGHSQLPQISQSGHSGTQQPQFSSNPSPARMSSRDPITNRNLEERSPTPSAANNQRSQVVVRKPALPPRPQGSPQQKSSAAMAPNLQPQRHQGASQPPQENQHPKEARQRLPMSQHPQEAQPRPPNKISQYSQPSQPQGSPQYPQDTMSQHQQPHYSPSAPQHARNVIPQHSQAPHMQGEPQQSKVSQAMHQVPHPQMVSEQTRRANAVPKHKPPPPPLPPRQSPKQTSQTRISPDTTPSQTQAVAQKPILGSIAQHPQASHLQGSPEQGHAENIQHPQAHEPERKSPLAFPKERNEGETQRLEVVPDSNTQQTKQAMRSTTAESNAIRTRPISSENLESKVLVDREQTRKSITQEEGRGAANSQHRLAESQEQQSENDKDKDTDCKSHQTQLHSTTEQPFESRSISGPQTMLNIFKARADAAFEASGGSPSFTDRESCPSLSA